MRYSQEYIEEVKSKIPGIAFSLFSSKGIANVTMQDIADECGIGVATLYRYYGTKVRLLIEVCVKKWVCIADEINANYKRLGGEKFTAQEEMEFCLNSYIYMYQNHKNFLRFNRNFELYVIQENSSPEDMQIYYVTANLYKQSFQNVFKKAYEDHTIRTDLSEEDIYFGIIQAMLFTATKYAEDSVYPEKKGIDYTQALNTQKKAYMKYLTNN